MLIPVDSLKPGMQLAHDVVNFNNVVLVVGGTRLTPQHVHTLKSWGIEAVPVKSEEASGTEAAPETRHASELLQAAEAQVNQRMKHVNLSDPGVVRLRELAIRRAAAKLASES
jgi:hypothetical protein